MNPKVKGPMILIPTWFVFIGGAQIYSHHDIHYENEQEKVWEKVDGLFSHTTITKRKETGETEIRRFSGFGTTNMYQDTNNDEKVDKIYKSTSGRGGHSTVLEKEKHGQKYKEEFASADQDFRKQMKRFKPFIGK